MVQIEGADIFAQDFIYEESIAEDKNKPSSEIQQFFNGATVFITGGTGFMGKVLIEKLLRCCPGIRKLYLLMRPKKEKCIEERFKEQFSGPLFEVLKKTRPDFTSTVTAIPGDCALVDLGLSVEDRTRLIREVNVVFHCAATVRFDELLRSAVRINILGTKCVMNLATSMINLQSIIHVSTAYSNCVMKEIHEKFYQPSLDYNKLTQLIDILDDQVIAELTPTLLKDWPNTYTYTKLVAEDVVRAYGHKLPVALIRPSIVISTAKEPIAGWINNLYGPQGVVFGAGLGLLRTLHCRPWVVADMVPVDYAISATIALAWHVGVTRGTQRNSEEVIGRGKHCAEGNAPYDVPVLNYVSSERRPITWRKFMEYNALHGIGIPSIHQFWVYSFTLNPNYYVDLVYRLFLHLMPAAILDSLAYITGRQPMLWKAYKKIHKFSKVISHFSTQQWKFSDQNVWRLWDTLSPRDQEIFNFDLENLDWDSYFYTYIRGLRQYMVNDDMKTVPLAKKKFIRLKVAHYTIKTLFYVLIGYLLWRYISWDYWMS